MQNKPETYKIYTDGGARGNPGPAAIGVVVHTPEGQILKFSKFIGIATNNIAEYKAVLLALNWIVANQANMNKPLALFLDSQLVARQLNGKYKVKNQELAAVFTKIKIMEKNLKHKIYYHEIPRTLNKIADHLVNTSLNLHARQ